MPNTMQLLDQALQKQRASAWARELNLTESAFSIAKKRGRLSPVLAGNLAIKLGENPEHWIAIAALEAEPNSELLAQLLASLMAGGSGEIRTHGGLASSAVFKTAAFNRSATLPSRVV